MNKNLVVGGSVVATIIVGVLFYFSLDQGEIEEITAAEETPITESPLIKVTVEGVVVLKNGNERNVIDGESIVPPYELKSNETGKAVIRFSEGSELRLDPNSRLIVDGAAYTPESKNLFVHVKLTVGRVWSDIVALATPESSWEVETSNVVATVRGTAFGVIAEENGTTTIIGSEHDIELTLIDPDTGERKESRKTKLGEDEFIVITNDEVKDDTLGAPTPDKKTGKEKQDPWFLLNEKMDDETSQPPVDLADEKDAAPRIEGNTDVDVDTGTPTKNTIPQAEPPPTTRLPSSPGSPSSAPAKKATSLTITPATTLEGIVENTSVRLTATLTYSDGSKEDVSAKVIWRVIGQIGSISGSVFTPRLEATVAEYGGGPGSITATWTNTATGESLLASTPIFNVKAKIGVINEQG